MTELRRFGRDATRGLASCIRHARFAASLPLLLLVLLGGGCTQDMKNQPKQKPLDESAFYRNRSSARLLPEGTVARGQLREDDLYYRGLAADGGFTHELPVELSPELLERGRERYQIFCSPCHGSQGNGLGMVVRRGFKQPASFHEARLRGMPVGYFFDVISNGFGQMSSYASQVPVADRWAIVSYIRALQLSRQVEAGELSAEEREKLEESADAGAHETSGEEQGGAH